MNQAKLRVYLFLFSVATLLVAAFGQEEPIRNLQCPPPAPDNLCLCVRSLGEVGFLCSGGANNTPISESVISARIAALRQVNNLTATDWIFIRSFWSDAKTSSLDLGAFLYTEIGSFYMDSRFMLERISGPPLDTSAGLIKIRSLDLAYTLLTDEGFGETFKYFNPTAMERITLQFAHNITGTPDRNSSDMEFLPGLGAFSNLKFLALVEIGIQKLKGGQFRGNNRLEWLILTSNNINEIGEDAFTMDPLPIGEPLPNRLELALNRQELSPSSWHINHGLDTIKQGVSLDLTYNDMETIPQNVFQSFLEAVFVSYMDLNANPIFCDPSLKWLKDRADEFRHKVLAYCLNDYPNSIFDSSLVG